MRLRPEPVVFLVGVVVVLAWGVPGAIAQPTASARSLDRACPDDEVAEDGFEDVPQSNVHEFALDCLTTWWDVAEGRSNDRYLPGRETSRAQASAFVARTIVRGDGVLPHDPTDHFTDDDTSVHEPDINRLAEAGILLGSADDRFEPHEPLSRAQLAGLLDRAYQWRTQGELSADGDYFVDDENSEHEAAINSIATAGITEGVSPGRYAPTGPVHRDEIASFAARFIDLLVEQDFATKAECPSSLPRNVRIVSVEPNTDASGESEHVTLVNRHCDALTLDAAWRLVDSSDNTIAIQELFPLGRGNTLRVYTGSGDHTRHSYYAGQSQPIWDEHDTASLYWNDELADRHDY